MSRSIPPVTQSEFNLGDLVRLLGTRTPVILEVGANDGSHTLAFLELFRWARIYAFEPDPRAAKKFKSRVLNSGVTLFEMAIGANDAEAAFHVSSGWPDQSEAVKIAYPEGWDMSGSLRAPKSVGKFWPWLKFDRTITVPVRRLDTWAAQHGITNVDLIWADVQGAEGDLIAGGHDTLARTRFFYTEYSNDEWYEGQPTLPELMDMLPNFRIVQRFTIDVLLENTALKRG